MIRPLCTLERLWSMRFQRIEKPNPRLTGRPNQRESKTADCKNNPSKKKLDDVPYSQQGNREDNHRAYDILEPAVGQISHFRMVVQNDQEEHRGHGEDKTVSHLGEYDKSEGIEIEKRNNESGANHPEPDGPELPRSLASFPAEDSRRSKGCRVRSCDGRAHSRSEETHSEEYVGEGSEKRF
jgi:hypothetical protein